MVGKTAQEVAKIASDLYKSMSGGGYATPQYQPQPQPGYQPQYMQQQPYHPQYQQPVGPQPPTEDEWSMQPQLAMQKYAEYLQATKFQPVIEQQWNTTGSLALQMAQTQHKQAFDKYGPEIMTLYHQLGPEARANAQNLDMIVQIVKGRHVGDMEREIEDRVRKDMEQKLASGGSLRPDSMTGQVAPSDQYSIDAIKEELPPDYRRLLNEQRIDDATLSEFLMTKGRDLFEGATLSEKKKAWVEMAKKGDILTERGFSYNG